MGHRPAFSGLERQARLRAVERLDLTLLVDRDDHRALGRVHLEADNVFDLLGELGIVGALEGANAVRLLHGAQADADGFGHGAAGPMRNQHISPLSQPDAQPVIVAFIEVSQFRDCQRILWVLTQSDNS